MAARYLAGAAYLQILPSLRGFQKKTATELRAVDVKAVANIVPQVDKSAAAKAEDDVQALTERLAKARDKEADAIGRVRVAEEKLKTLRAGGKATVDQLAAAEERLAAAVRASEQAQKTTVVSTRALESAQNRHKQAVDDLTRSTERGTSALVKLWQQGAGIDRMSASLRTARREALALSAGAYRAASGVTAIGSAVPVVTGLAGAMGTASGAGLLLPAAIGTGVVAVTALRVGVSGLSDAMKAAAEGDAKKLQEATAKLAPAARAVVEEYLRFKPAVDGLRLDVQERLFAGVAGEVRALARDYLPLVRTGLAEVAGRFNTAAREAAGFARQQQTLRDTPLIFSQTSAVMGNLVAATQPLLSVLRDVVAVGGTVLVDLTAGAGAAAQGFAAFIAQARATGQLEGWIRGGLDVLRQFGDLLGNVGTIFGAVFGASQVATGGGLLAVVTEVTGAIGAMLQSGPGFQALVTVFSTIHQVVQALLPGLQAVAGAVFEGIAAVGPQLPALAAAFSAAAIAVAPLVVDLATLAAVVLPPLADLIGWLAPALPALAVGFAAGAVALKGYAIVSTLIGWYRLWTAGQIALNIAMAANPIGIVVVAVAALVAAIVWIATQTTWFQDLWTVVWDGIKTAATAVWNGVLQPAFAGIVTAVEAIGAAAQWLWGTVLKPVFDAIGLIVRIVAAVIITALVTPVVLAFKLFAAVATWLWTTVLEPIFSALGTVFTALWNGVLAPVVDSIVAGLRVWGAVFTWLWGIVSPVLSAIGAALLWLWQNHGQPVFSALGTALNALGTAFSWLWENIVRPLWDAFGLLIAWVWENRLKPVFDAIGTALDAVGGAFQAAVDAIKLAWNRVYEVVSTPIKWVVDVVYNNGIRAVWNKVASLVGLGQLDPIVFGGGDTGRGGGGRGTAHMAHGGVLPGYAPGVDSIPVLASPGEGWLVPEAVRGLGAGFVGWANRFFSRGRSGGGTGTGGPAGFAGGGVVQRFADGGIVGNLLGWVSDIGDSVVRLWKDPVGFIKAQLGDTGWTDLIARSPARLIGDGAAWLWGRLKEFFGFSSDQAASAAGPAGGAPQGWQQMWDIIRAQFPTATLNSAFRPGDPGYHGKGRAVDLGGPMGAINSWIARVYPNSTQLIYTPGVNLLNGRPFTYDAPTQADHLDHVHWAFDQGGYLPPGYSTVYNGTGRPEPVLTDEQWARMGGDDGPQRITGTLDLGNGLVGFVDGRIEANNQAMGTALMHRRRP